MLQILAIEKFRSLKFKLRTIKPAIHDILWKKEKQNKAEMGMAQFALACLFKNNNTFKLDVSKMLRTDFTKFPTANDIPH